MDADELVAAWLHLKGKSKAEGMDGVDYVDYGEEDSSNDTEDIASEARVFLEDFGNYHSDALGDLLRLLYIGAFLAGGYAAAQMLSNVLPEGTQIQPGLWSSVDWSKWEPGSPLAAEIVRGVTNNPDSGLARLLAQADVVIKSIAQNRISDLANALADGLARGDSSYTIGQAIRSILLDPSRAGMVASTEVARAMTAASLDTYRRNGIEYINWIAQPDACEDCEMSSLEGPVPIDEGFSLGEPPIHPWDRCAVEPYMGAFEEGP